MADPSNTSPAAGLGPTDDVGGGRRVARRFEVALSASERSGPFEVVWTTTDLSVTGLSIRDSFSRPVGTRVHLQLELEDGHPPLPVTAEVIGAYDEAGGVRVHFVELPEAGRLRIRDALRED
ncbi:MAG TPA: PilZ domain-containing protein [Myxococcaceae bacterium]|nr:PilZ domain-containing protein [Myxococcaceae bacterium]